MALNLTPTQRAEYERRLIPLEVAKQAAVAMGDRAAAKRARQMIGALHDEFRALEPPPPPPTEWELEQSMTLEQRVERIERTLKLGVWSE